MWAVPVRHLARPYMRHDPSGADVRCGRGVCVCIQRIQRLRCLSFLYGEGVQRVLLLHVFDRNRMHENYTTGTPFVNTGTADAGVEAAPAPAAAVARPTTTTPPHLQPPPSPHLRLQLSPRRLLNLHSSSELNITRYTPPTQTTTPLKYGAPPRPSSSRSSRSRCSS